MSAGLQEPELHKRLSRYVSDLNTIFAKQTVRRFLFDPGRDIEPAGEIPFTGYFIGALPEAGYEIWAHIQPSQHPEVGSYGGYSSVDVSGAGVAAGLFWDAIHDASALSPGSRESQQYWKQLHHLTHELEHIFGAGISEVYNLRQVEDTTGVEPIQSIRYSTADPYWASRADYYTDPLLLWSPTLSYETMMERVRFSDTTTALINNAFRSPGNFLQTVPDLSRTRVLVQLGDSGPAVENARVRVWNVGSIAPYSCLPIFDGYTQTNGSVEFDWSGGFSTSDHLMVIKVFPTNGLRPAVEWFSIFDAQRHKLVLGQEQLEIIVTLDAAQNSFAENESNESADDAASDPLPAPVNPPANVSASNGLFPTHVRLSWNSVDQAESYDVWRNSVDNPRGATRLNREAVFEERFDDAGAVVGTRYWYWITARANGAVSEFSESASGTVPPAPVEWTILWQHQDGWLARWTMAGARLTEARYLSPDHITENEWAIAAPGDFNGDGHTDLLWQHENGALALWYLEEFQAQEARLIEPVRAEAGWVLAATGNFNGDGSTDLVWQHQQGALAVWLMNGHRSIAATLVDNGQLPGGASITAAADFDRDGGTDLLARHSDGTLEIWYVSGLRVVRKEALDEIRVSNDWRISGAGDFNGEGGLELVVRQTDGRLAVWVKNESDRWQLESLEPPQAEAEWRIVGVR